MKHKDAYIYLALYHYRHNYKDIHSAEGLRDINKLLKEYGEKVKQGGK